MKQVQAPRARPQLLRPAWHQALFAALARVGHRANAAPFVALAVDAGLLAAKLRAHDVVLRAAQHARRKAAPRQRLGEVQAAACRSSSRQQQGARQQLPRASPRIRRARGRAHRLRGTHPWGTAASRCCRRET